MPFPKSPANPAEREERLRTLLSELTLEEKVALTHGRFLSGGVARLGIGQLEVADGPVGIRLPTGSTQPKTAEDEEVEETAVQSGQPARTTAMPATLLLAATWNREASRTYAETIANEMLATGKHVLLAPGINLMRDPRGGRNYEYFGEDPFLTAEMGIAYVRGLQENGVGSNLKHFVANECDRDRHFASSNLDPVTLREVYAYPFERAIREADAWSLMTGNNLCNAVHVAESEDLLRRLLREEIGFDGVILTDWRSAYEPLPSANASLDMTTGFCEYVFGDGRLEKAFADGELPMALLDAMALRILRLYDRCGVLEPEARQQGEIDSPEHRRRARSIAAEGMILIKNDHRLLPVPEPKQILVTGPGATAAEIGTGSGLVNNGSGNVSPIEGLRERFGDRVVRIEAPTPDDLLTEADLVVYFANAVRGGEGKDIDSIELPDGQDAEIRELGRSTDKLLVVLQTGTATDTTSWDDAADAILVAWYGGQATGHAIADLISGEVTPSGKLPCTFGNQIADFPCGHHGTWPARLVLDKHPGKAGHTPAERKQIYALAADYSEGLLVGHRHFEKHGIAPRYPFGFGLSYTTFELSEPTITTTEAGWSIECAVTNSGSVDGQEVVQLYVESPRSSQPDRPGRQLRGFGKGAIPAQETRTVRIDLPKSSLAIYAPESGNWQVEPGTYMLHIGTSSRDLPFQIPLKIAPE